MFAYDFHAGGETMMSRHFNDPNADAYFTKRKWGKKKMQAHYILTNVLLFGRVVLYFKMLVDLSL